MHHWSETFHVKNWSILIKVFGFDSDNTTKRIPSIAHIGTHFEPN